MFALLLAAPATGYTLKSTDEGELLRWQTFPVSYTWNGGGPLAVDDPEQELASAFARWEEVPGTGLSFLSIDGHVPSPVESPEDALDLVWPTRDWPFDPDLLAMTSSWSRDDSGELVAYDVRVNANQPWATDGRPDAYDFRAAMTHEVGHVLGLDHSELETATMFATTARGEPRRADLDPDDEAGVRFLYRASRADSAGLGLSCSTTPNTPVATTFLVLASGLARRRRRLP
jgi:uncharacterized protein (TIGR03382 family)